MSSKKRWSFNPDVGGVKIPEAVKINIAKRINAIAEKYFKGKYTRLDIRFKGQFCYIDAYEEPTDIEGWPHKNWPETREERIERLRNIPVHLCRLGYFGDDQWGYAFYAYSSEKYLLSVFPDGSFFGKPEDAFIISANMYIGSND